MRTWTRAAAGAAVTAAVLGVGGGAGAQTGSPHVAVDRPEGHPGVTRVVKATGCVVGGVPGTGVLRPGPGADPVGSAPAAGDGTWEVSFTVPAEAPFGALALVPSCEVSGGGFEYSHLPFRVLPPGELTVRMVPQMVRTARLDGTGCLVGGGYGGTLHTVLRGPGGEVAAVADATASVAGVWRTYLTPSLSASPGTYTVTAQCLRPDTADDVIVDYPAATVEVEAVPPGWADPLLSSGDDVPGDDAPGGVPGGGDDGPVGSARPARPVSTDPTFTG